jgi:hypothetical protein
VISKLLVVAGCIVTLGACQTAPPTSFSPTPVLDSAAVRERTTRFYASRDYGSESQLNPISLIVNGGFDQLRTSPTRPIFKLAYGPGFHSLWYSVLHYDAVVRHFGVSNWLRDEVFPLSGKGSGGGQWYPNYHLHLLGGGATYAEMVEWFEQHGASHPELLSGFTMYGWHVLTETVEHLGYCCENEDSLTDLTIFDLGSIILFNQDWAKRQFGRALEFKTWQGQPAMIGQSLENAYMMAMIRTQLPGTTNWRAINTFGNAFLFGPSRRVGADVWVSATAGFDPVDNPVIDAATNKKTATLKPNAGVFLDRQGSLLVSFITKGGSTNGPTLNIYPGVVGWHGVSPGLWVQQVRGGGMRYGIVSPWGLGLGWLQH